MTIELHQPATSVPDLADRMRYAEALAASSLLPKAYQRQPANVLLAVELGQALGIPSIQAINGIHVVEGKPTASADLIASLVRRAGHKLRIAEQGAGDTLSVTATLIRADDPDFAFTATWDMAKAKAAGLVNKGVWKSYPGQMLRARAITEVCRQGASDALYGVIYTPEELGADPSKPAPAHAPAPAPVMSLAEAVAAEAAAPSDEQTAELGRLLRDRGMRTAAEQMGCISEALGREVHARGDLTADDVARVIDVLSQPEAVEAEVVDEATGEVAYDDAAWMAGGDQ